MVHLVVLVRAGHLELQEVVELRELLVVQVHLVQVELPVQVELAEVQGHMELQEVVELRELLVQVVYQE